jgi:hypothetical protein
MMRPPDPAPGLPILADHILYIYDLLEKAKVSVVPPLFLDEDGGIFVDESPGIWVTLGANASGAYAWQEIYATPMGGWANAVRSGTTTADPAYELNGNMTDLTGKNARVWRDIATGEMRFQWGSC